MRALNQRPEREIALKSAIKCIKQTAEMINTMKAEIAEMKKQAKNA
jgi:hypothetical protein